MNTEKIDINVMGEMYLDYKKTLRLSEIPEQLNSKEIKFSYELLDKDKFPYKEVSLMEADCKTLCINIPAKLEGHINADTLEYLKGFQLISKAEGGILRKGLTNKDYHRFYNVLEKYKQTQKVKPIKKAKKVKKSSAPKTSKAGLKNLIAVASLSNREEKKKIHNMLLDKIGAELTPGGIYKDKKVKMFTLPGSEWGFELKALNTLRYKYGATSVEITGVEHDMTTYTHGLLSCPYGAKSLNIGDNLFMTTSFQEKFNMLWFDYMGAIVNEHVNSFEMAIKNGNVADNALLALTFQNGREAGEINAAIRSLTDPAAVNQNVGRKAVTIALYKHIAFKHGYMLNMHGNQTFTYKDAVPGHNSSPMFFLLFTLTKATANQRAACKAHATRQQRKIEALGLAA